MPPSFSGRPKSHTFSMEIYLKGIIEIINFDSVITVVAASLILPNLTCCVTFELAIVDYAITLE